MFEQAFRNIDDVLRKEAGCTTELDYTEQTSWLLFLKYLDDFEQDRADEAGLNGKKYVFILDKTYRWEGWAAPKGKDGKLDHNKAMTGDDLRDFVNQKLFPYLHDFKQKASGPNTIEYKIGEIFGEIKNKIQSGYNLREIIDHIDELRFRSQVEKHELAHLYEAFEGIATAKAEKNLKNARFLFESYLQSVFAEAWQTCELVTLSDLATDIRDGDHLPPPKAPTGVPFITIGNIIKETRKIDFSDTFMVPHAYFNGLKPNKKPKKGDVLYTVTGSFGIPVIVSENAEFCFQRHIGLIRPKSETSSDWLYYLLLSPQILKQANDGATGTAQKTVSLKLLRNFEVPKVTFKQQQLAVAMFDKLSAETQRLASLYERKLAALESLKKSLLHQAFTGEL